MMGKQTTREGWVTSRPPGVLSSSSRSAVQPLCAAPGKQVSARRSGYAAFACWLPSCVRAIAPMCPSNREDPPVRLAVLLERRRRPVFREGVVRRGKVPGRAGRYGKGVGGPRRFHQDRRNTAPRRWPILPRHDAHGSEERGNLALDHPCPPLRLCARELIACNRIHGRVACQ